MADAIMNEFNPHAGMALPSMKLSDRMSLRSIKMPLVKGALIGAFALAAIGVLASSEAQASPKISFTVVNESWVYDNNYLSRWSPFSFVLTKQVTISHRDSSGFAWFEMTQPANQDEVWISPATTTTVVIGE